MSPRLCLLITTLGLCLTGCDDRVYTVNDGDYWIDGHHHARRRLDAPVDVYWYGQSPTRPYTVICVLREKADDEAIRELRIRARAWGAEALVFSERGHWSHGGGYASAALGVGFSASSSGDSFEAVGIVYTDHVAPVANDDSAEPAPSVRPRHSWEAAQPASSADEQVAPPAERASPSPPPAPPAPGKADQMRDLMTLHNDGVISDEEYQRRKNALLGLPPPAP